MGFVRFLEYVVASAVLIALVVFSVSNRGRLEINLFPFPIFIEVPVYIALIGALSIGIVIGGLVGFVAKLGARLNMGSLFRGRVLSGEKSIASKEVRNTPHSPESGV